jgi:hypothetical protein
MIGRKELVSLLQQVRIGADRWAVRAIVGIDQGDDRRGINECHRIGCGRFRLGCVFGLSRCHVSPPDSWSGTTPGRFGEVWALAVTDGCASALPDPDDVIKRMDRRGLAQALHEILLRTHRGRERIKDVSLDEPLTANPASTQATFPEIATNLFGRSSRLAASPTLSRLKSLSIVSYPDHDTAKRVWQRRNRSARP